MSVLWDRGSATVAEILERLSDEITYSTVMTVLRTLEAKGHVTGQDEAGDTALSRILNKVYHGSRELLINRLVSDEEVSAEEIRRIQEYLEKRLKEMHR
jgi:predicted transcriptional regulator